jgi:hypothetical protein
MYLIHKRLLAIGLVTLMAGPASAQTNATTTPATGQTNASLQAQRLYSGLTAALPNTQPTGTLGAGLTTTTGSSAPLGQQPINADAQMQRLYSGLVAALPANPTVPQTSTVPGFTTGGNLQGFGSATPASVPLVGQLGANGISVNVTPQVQRFYNGLLATQPLFPSIGTTGVGMTPPGPRILPQTPGTPFNPAINPGNGGIPTTGTVNPTVLPGAGTSAPGTVNPANPTGARTLPGTGTAPVTPGTTGGAGRPGGT